MLTLETFGGLVLTDAAGSGIPLQRRRLALLVLLAVAGDRGLSRDRIVAFLWPEAPAENARHNLEQLLYLLRRQLGEDLFAGADPLRLNERVIASDVAVFERGLARGEDTVAVATYRGPFLDGFYLADAGGFERWADGERMRLAAAHASALERLATAADERGDHPAAITFWRRLVAADPLNSRSVLGLLRSIAASGDRSEALRLAAAYESLIREELGIGVEPEVEALVAYLRAGRGPASGPARSVPVQSTRSEAVAPEITPVPSALRAVAHEPAAGEKRAATRFATRRPHLVIAVLSALTIGLAYVASQRNGAVRADTPDPDRVMVMPFRVTGNDSSFAAAGELLAMQLAAQLTGEGGPGAIDMRATVRALRSLPADERDVADERLLGIARGLGAGEVLLGELVVTTSARVELSGRIVSTVGRSDAAVRASVAGHADSMAQLIERLAGRLLVLRAREHPQRLPTLALRSPESLRPFLEGRSELRRGHAEAARILFARALEHDSTFAHAALELALATANVFRWTTVTTDTVALSRGVSLGGDIRAPSDEDVWHRAMDLAWRGRDQLPPADRALLLALRVNYPLESFAHETLAGWERALRAAPDRPEAHYWYGYVLLHQGYALGLADSRTRAASSFAHAFALDSAYLSPLAGLIEIAAYERDTRSLRRLRALYLARDSIGDQADYVRWLAAAATSDEQELHGIRARLASFDIATLARMQRTSQMAALALDDADRAHAAILGRTHERQQRQIALYRAIFLMLNSGRPDEALRLTELKREVDPGAELGQGFAIRYALMWDADSTAGANAARALEAGAQQTRALNVTRSITLWRLWQADTTGAAVAIARMRLTHDPFAELLDAMLAEILGRPDAPAARARLDSLALRGCCTQPHFINLVSARLHERAGDLPAALRAIRRGRWFHPPEYLSTHLREEGRLAALTGDTAGAIAAYQHYLALRSNAEPSIRPALDRVRAELDRLGPEPDRRTPRGRNAGPRR